jgi:hypothetical protein
MHTMLVKIHTKMLYASAALLCYFWSENLFQNSIHKISKTICCTTAYINLQASAKIKILKTHTNMQASPGDCRCSCAPGWTGTLCTVLAPHVACAMRILGMTSRAWALGEELHFRRRYPPSPPSSPSLPPSLDLPDLHSLIWCIISTSTIIFTISATSTTVSNT